MRKVTRREGKTISYHGYLPIVVNHLLQLPHPKILEVGVDHGQMFFPILHHLCMNKEKFIIVGVDVRFHDHVPISVAGFGQTKDQQVALVQSNSLTTLPEFVQKGLKFDVILLDGDHNYHTVSQELEHINSLTGPESIVVVDDYTGRWSEKDLWYSERPGYETVEISTKRTPTDKEGVKPAVDEFLSSHPDWMSFTLMPGEPIVLKKTVQACPTQDR